MLHEKALDSLKARLPEIRDERREILEKIPSHDYVLDLDAVRAALVEPQRSTKSSPKKSAQPVPVRKRSTVAKKKSGRKISK
jgi:hypothetical protein